MPTLFLQVVRGKNQTGLVAYDDRDMEDLDKLPTGKRLRAKIVRDRSLPWHHLMFYSFRRLAEVLNDGPAVNGVIKVWDENSVRTELLISLGYADRSVATPEMMERMSIPGQQDIDKLIESYTDLVLTLQAMLDARTVHGAGLTILRDAVTKSWGAIEGMGPIGGCYILRPQSMAFESMDQAQAYEFFTRSVDYVLATFGDWVEGHPSWVKFLNAVGQMAVPQPEREEA